MRTKILLIVILFFAFSLVTLLGPSSSHPATILAAGLPAATQRVPDGLSASDWNSIRAEYERNRHAAFRVAGEHRARNPEQRWLSRFEGRGFSVEPDGAGWRWGLELESYGFPGHEKVVKGPAPVTAEKERLKYAWDEALQEWFVNDQRGLEHGFTLQQRPPGGGERLTIRLAVRGGLRPQVQTDGRVVTFVDTESRAMVQYAGLKVWDADGKTLDARFDAFAGGLNLVMKDSGARYPLTIDPLAQQAYLKASNTGEGDGFGTSVAASGDTVVVGAPYEAGNATGVNGNQTDNSATDAGAAYVFVRTGGGWSQQAYLKASNTDADDNFGAYVAVSGDTVVVGAPLEASGATGVNGFQSDNSATGAGAAYVFVRTGGEWSQQAYLKASNTEADDNFATSVAVSGDTVVAGAPYEASNAIGVNGKQSDNNAEWAGAAYVFVRSGGVWSQQAYLKASNTEEGDNFGISVAVSGDTTVVGAWMEASNATGVNGNQRANNTLDAGAAYVFVRSGSAWSQQAYLKASNTGEGDSFGGQVAVSGGTVVVGASGEASDATGVNGNQSDNSAPYSGAAYVFVRSGGVWSQQAYLKASNTEEEDEFGRSVTVSGDTVVVGANFESSNATGINGDQGDNSAALAGAAYVFVRSGGVWSHQAYLKASNTETFDLFGSSVAVSGGTVVVGARGESSNATGVDSDQSDNSATYAGAAYAFSLENPQQASAVGVFLDGWWYLDVNGNGLWEPTIDRASSFGWAGTKEVLGDWNGDGKTEIGVFKDGAWYLDYNGNGVWDGYATDRGFQFGWPGVTPVVGDWNGDGKTEIGVFYEGYWYLDYSGNGGWDGFAIDKEFLFGWSGVTPVVGDWNGDGKTKIGVYHDGYWYLDYNGSGGWDGFIIDKGFGFGWSGVTPVVGDWNGDGKTKVGVFLNGAWYLDYNGSGGWNGGAVDRFYSFGWPGVTQVLGDWNGDGKTKIGVFSNGAWYLDYNGNGSWEGAPTDRTFGFGWSGVTPVVANW